MTINNNDIISKLLDDLLLHKENDDFVNIHIISAEIRISNCILIEDFSLDENIFEITGGNFDLVFSVEDINVINYVENEMSYGITIGNKSIYIDFM